MTRPKMAFRGVAPWVAILAGITLEGGGVILAGQGAPTGGLALWTAGAALIAWPPTTISAVSNALGRLQAPGPASEELVARLEACATKARREGLLALETEVAACGDRHLRAGVQLVADGLDQDAIAAMLDRAIAGELARAETAARGVGVVAAAACAGSALLAAHLAGVAAAVVGAAAIALGLGLPLAARLAAAGRDAASLERLVRHGVLAIQAGDNPQIVGIALALETRGALPAEVSP